MCRRMVYIALFSIIPGVAVLGLVPTVGQSEEKHGTAVSDEIYALPDLVVKEVCANGFSSDSYYVAYTVANVGGEGPPGLSTFTVNAYVSTEPEIAGAHRLYWGTSVLSYHLAKGWSVTISHTIPLNHVSKDFWENVSGDYYCIVEVDSGVGGYPGVSEADESNNWSVSRNRFNEYVGPVACIQCTPLKPMAGGQIRLDGTCSTGCIEEYDWDLGDGQTADDPVVTYVYQKPGVYTVRLVVTNSAGESSRPASKVLDLRLSNGDLLFWHFPGSLVPGYWSHVGIYRAATNSVIEARPWDPPYVWDFPFADWSYPEATCVQAMRVKTSQDIRDSAVIHGVTEMGAPFEWVSFVLGRKDAGDSDGWGWYCSELVWACYMRASSGAVNLDPDAFEVSPTEIACSTLVELVGTHVEEDADVFSNHFLSGRTQCPVDMEVRDPDGRVLSKYKNSISGARYEEVIVGPGGQKNDVFAIPNAKPGRYTILVVPESGAASSETYSLEVAVDGETSVLAKDVLVRNAPREPYAIVVGDGGTGPGGPNPIVRWKLDEAEGTVARDSVGQNHGTVYGAPAGSGPNWQATGGRVGGALSFDGIDDYIDCGNPPSFSITDAVTAAAWIKVAAFDKRNQAIVTKGDTAWRIQRNGLTNTIEFACTGLSVASGSSTGSLSGRKQIPLGEWHHIAGVYDGAQTYLYVDGALDASQKAQGRINVNTQPVLIGENAGARGRFWKGMIDDVRLYDSALTSDQIKELAGAGGGQGGGGGGGGGTPQPPAGTSLYFAISTMSRAVPLTSVPGSPGVSNTFTGCTTIELEMNFKLRLTATVVSTSAAGGTWTATLDPEVISPSSGSTSLCLKGENLNLGALPAGAGNLEAAKVTLHFAPAP